MRRLAAVAVSFLLAEALLAQSKPAPGQPVVMPASDLKWTDLDPKGAPGVKVADL